MRGKLTGVKGEDELAMKIGLNKKGTEYIQKRLFLYVKNLKGWRKKNHKSRVNEQKIKNLFEYPKEKKRLKRKW